MKLYWRYKKDGKWTWKAAQLVQADKFDRARDDFYEKQCIVWTDLEHRFYREEEE